MTTLPIRVLIVDDSASVRAALTEMLADDAGVSVIGAAADPFAAADLLKGQLPDVIILDIEMPRMNGLTFLRKIMSQRPIPVIICSTMTEAGSPMALDALELGAFDVIAKPRRHTPAALHAAADHLRRAVRAAAQSRLRMSVPNARPVERKLTADVILPPCAALVRATTQHLVCIGISTGGTETLREVLQMLPAASPGILVVQHMPQGFTAAFARRLDGLCRVSVKEAEDGDEVRPGQVLIAPGNHHLLIARTGARYQARVKDGPAVSRHRPSADVLFRSAAQQAGPNALGIIMTGMGDDGARGLLEMRRAGARTLAQDEASCIVFGMPKEAIAAGAVERVAALQQIAREIVGWGAAIDASPSTELLQ